MLNLTVIIASTRPGRVGTQIGEWFTKRANDHAGFDIHLVDLAELGLPFLDEPEVPEGVSSAEQYLHQHTRNWSAVVNAADAFTFVMPEYNNGFSAPLKNAIDYLFREWNHKPVAFVCYGMSSAGLRAVHMIKPVVSAVQMVPVEPTVSIPLRQHLDSSGKLTSTDQMDEHAGAALDELERLATALATVRRPR